MKIYVIAIILTTIAILLGAVGWMVQAPIIFLMYFLFAFFYTDRRFRNFIIVALPFLLMVFFAMYYQNHYAGVVIWFSPIFGAVAGYVCAKLRRQGVTSFLTFTIPVAGVLLVIFLNNTWISYINMRSGISDENVFFWNVVNVDGGPLEFNSQYSIIHLWSIDCADCKTYFPFWAGVKDCADKYDGVDFRSLHLPFRQLSDNYSIEAEVILAEYKLESESNIYLDRNDSIDLTALDLYGVSSYMILKKDQVKLSQHTVNIKGSWISSRNEIQAFFKDFDSAFVTCLDKV